MLEKQPGRCLDLPARVRAVREYEGVRLKKIRYEEEQPVKERRAEQTTVCLTIPGTTVLPEQNLKVTCRILEKNPLSEGIDIPQKTYTKWFDYDIIKKCLHIRTRQSGDWITVDGAGHRQKLKSWFVNEKIPYKQREEIPLIAEGNQIVWILGYRMGSAYRISSETKRILQIDVEKMKSTEEKKNG